MQAQLCAPAKSSPIFRGFWTLGCGTLGLLAVVLASPIIAAQAQSTAALKAALKNPDEKARIVAIDGLAKLGPGAQDAVDDLVTQLADESASASVRAHAAWALGCVGKGAKSAAPALVKTAADPDFHVRRESVEALKAIGDADVANPVLAAALDDKDPSVRVAALDALTEFGAAGVPVLSSALSRPGTRYWAALALGELGPTARAAVPQLAEALSDERPDVRRELLLAIGRIGADAAPAVPQITTLITDKDQAVRNAAAYALGQIGPPAASSLDALRAGLKSEDELLPTVCAWAMARIEPDSKEAKAKAKPLLLAALRHKNPRVQALSLKGLLDMGTPPTELLPVLNEVLAESDPKLVDEILAVLAASGHEGLPGLILALKRPESRGHAALLLERLGPKASAAVPGLLAAVGDKSADVRREALYALGAILAGKGPADPVIIAALDDHDSQVRATAAYALGRIGPAARDAAGKLRPLLESEEPLVRVVSAWALVHITPQDDELTRKAVPILIQGLKSETVAVRRGSAHALGKLGPKARDAAGALTDASRDSDETVRAAALAALEQLGVIQDKAPARPRRLKQR
jgi:HEAT repeat protein